MVGLTGIESLKPSELSGGMRKRVSIARSIAMSPKYLFYDEPTTGLDPIMSDVINDLIVDLHKKLGQTGVVITHDMRSAYKISSRIAMLYEGRILQVDTPENIKNSQDPVVRQFVTGSAQGPIQMKLRVHDLTASRLPASVCHREQGRPLCPCRDGGAHGLDPHAGRTSISARRTISTPPSTRLKGSRTNPRSRSSRRSRIGQIGRPGRRPRAHHHGAAQRHSRVPERACAHPVDGHHRL